VQSVSGGRSKVPKPKTDASPTHSTNTFPSQSRHEAVLAQSQSRNAAGVQPYLKSDRAWEVGLSECALPQPSFWKRVTEMRVRGAPQKGRAPRPNRDALEVLFSRPRNPGCLARASRKSPIGRTYEFYRESIQGHLRWDVRAIGNGHIDVLYCSSERAKFERMSMGGLE
jgi:hypothetical protein